MRIKADLTVTEASRILKSDPQQVRYGMRNGTLPIGWYVQNKNGRYAYHIIVARFCKFTKMSKEEFEVELNKIRNNNK